jgi:hypothetical protein
MRTLPQAPVAVCKVTFELGMAVSLYRCSRTQLGKLLLLHLGSARVCGGGGGATTASQCKGPGWHRYAQRQCKAGQQCCWATFTWSLPGPGSA